MDDSVTFVHQRPEESCDDEKFNCPKISFINATQVAWVVKRLATRTESERKSHSLVAKPPHLRHEAEGVVS